ncbi:hypothetical protein [Amycolatopsis sulphurea]|uniref:hypothetical protein n=1 Tax=Amycolatopsis sulphurea TaxID=76022 RepID=UPI0036A5B0C6
MARRAGCFATPLPEITLPLARARASRTVTPPGPAARGSRRASAGRPAGSGHARCGRRGRCDGAVPLPFAGAAMVRGAALADALAVLPPGGARPGECAEVLELPR